MRSELVFGAMIHIQNRYLLARLTSKTTRVFHRPHTRLEETANHVLRLFSHSNPQQIQRSPSDFAKPSTATRLEFDVHDTERKPLNLANTDLAGMVT